MQNLRLAARTLFLRSPVLAITAILTLTIAIGANTAIFSLIDAAFLRPLPYPDAGRIVQFWFSVPGGGEPILSIPEIMAFAADSQAFQDVAAYDSGGPGVSIGTADPASSPEQVQALHVAAPYFRLFGATPLHGRTFTDEEDHPNGGTPSRVAVLSHDLWQRRFGGDTRLIGHTILLGGEPHTVTGVLAPGFVPDQPAQVWLPLQADPNSVSHAHYLRAAARLRPGVTLDQANARLKLTFADFLRKYPLFNPQAGFSVLPLRETSVRDVRAQLRLLSVTVAFVLLIACANIANLLLARASARSHEMAIRSALGASRADLMKQVLAECAWLAVVGGALGTLVGYSGLRFLVVLYPDSVPTTASFDWRMLVFTTAITFLATLLFGLLPALRGSYVSTAGAAGARIAPVRLKSLLVASEVALAVMLFAGAGLLLRTWAALRNVNPGVDTERILTMQMSLQGSRFMDSATVSDFVNRSVTALRELPGVEAAASTWMLPVEWAFGSTFVITGRPLEQGTGARPVHGPTFMRPVSPEYASVFRIPVLQGRFFDSRDSGQSPSVAVISNHMARKYWPQGDAIGQRIELDKYMGPDFAAPPREIIGIAADVRDGGLHREPEAMVYIPQSQVPSGMTRLDKGILPITWVIRTKPEVADPYSLAPAARKALQTASGGLAIGRTRSMRDVVRQSTSKSDSNTALLALFAGVSLLLAAVGIHGVIAFSVEQRTREMGIRFAVGATPAAVQRMVLRDAMRLAILGMLAGLAGSAALSRFMTSLLYGVQPLDPGVLTISGMALLATAAAAAWLPALRAAKVDPVVVLRY
jgi:putative ABC transport system permease protein